MKALAAEMGVVHVNPASTAFGAAVNQHCVDAIGFVDSSGRTCADYEPICSGMTMTRDQIILEAVAGAQSALETCCACGGGREQIVMQGGETLHVTSGVGMIPPDIVVANDEPASLAVMCRGPRPLVRWSKARGKPYDHM